MTPRKETEPTKDIEYRVVTYIFRPGAEERFGLLPGYCVMAMRQASAWDGMEARESGRVHRLKTVEPYFTAVRKHIKTHELRKDDRGFEVGDLLELERYVPPASPSPESSEPKSFNMGDWRVFCRDGHPVIATNEEHCPACGSKP